MQVRRCSISSRLIRNSGHGEGSGLLSRKRRKSWDSLLSDEQIEELKAHADDINYDVAKEREKIVRHDVMSHVYAYGQQCRKRKESFIWEQHPVMWEIIRILLLCLRL